MRTPPRLSALAALLLCASAAGAQTRVEVGRHVAGAPARIVHRGPARPRARALRAAVPALAAPRLAAPRRAPLLRASAMPRAAARTSPVVTVLQRMETTLQFTRYSPDNRVDPLMGHYELDAPGLVTWVLRRATPAAHRAVFAQVRARSPTARDYHDILAAAPDAVGAGDAWLRVREVGALRPGDVVAWRRPAGNHGAAGTHVAFVAAPPVRAPAGAGWLVRVTDSTAAPHDNDTRGPQSRHRSGLGTGTLLLASDPATDAPVGYGWSGARTPAVTHTSIALGRPLR